MSNPRVPSTAIPEASISINDSVAQDVRLYINGDEWGARRVCCESTSRRRLETARDDSRARHQVPGLCTLPRVGRAGGALRDMHPRQVEQLGGRERLLRVGRAEGGVVMSEEYVPEYNFDGKRQSRGETCYE